MSDSSYILFVNSFLCATSKLGRSTVPWEHVEGRALESERGHSSKKYSAHNTSTTAVSERGDAANQRRLPQMVLVGRKTGRAVGRNGQRAFPLCTLYCTLVTEWRKSDISRRAAGTLAAGRNHVYADKCMRRRCKGELRYPIRGNEWL